MTDSSRKFVPKYPYASSHSGGVKPMVVRGLYEDERCRLSTEYSDEERRWRKQWFKDQILAPDEPREVPELERMLKNPVRRLASMPWKFIESKMQPVFGRNFSHEFRYIAPKCLVGIMLMYVGYYHIKYNHNDWKRLGGVYVTTNRPTILPGDPGFPNPGPVYEASDYDDRGFKARNVFRD